MWVFSSNPPEPAFLPFRRTTRLCLPEYLIPRMTLASSSLEVSESSSGASSTSSPSFLNSSESKMARGSSSEEQDGVAISRTKKSCAAGSSASICFFMLTVWISIRDNFLFQAAQGFFHNIKAFVCLILIDDQRRCNADHIAKNAYGADQ